VSAEQIAVATEADGVDRYLLEQITESNARWSEGRIPRRFAAASVDLPAVRDWVCTLVRLALEHRGVGDPAIGTGPSLLLVGKVGRGKTHQAVGALRSLAVSGVHCRWSFAHEMDLLASLRPRDGVDSEEVFEGYASAAVLVVDDLGSERPRSPWVESQIARLINRRYEAQRPTMLTTNVLPSEFTAVFGERVVSRLTEMCQQVPVAGPDRRRTDGMTR
jgi:DNA replication protein DnaC